MAAPGKPPKNKGGARPNAGRKKSLILAHARELDESNGPDAYLFMCRVFRGEEPDAEMSDRVKAAQYVCDHWRGKAKERVEVTGADDAPLLDGLAAAMKSVSGAIDHALNK